MKRVRLNQNPRRIRLEYSEDFRYMDEGTWKWLCKTAIKHHWRLARTYDLEDLISEGIFVYYRVLRKYPNVPTRRQLMAKFMKAFTNHIIFLSSRQQKSPKLVLFSELLLDADVDVGLDTFFMVESTLEDADSIVLDEIEWKIPEPVKAALRCFIDPAKCEKLREPYARRPYGRETFNERLCRLCGYDTETDLVGMLRCYLSGKMCESHVL